MESEETGKRYNKIIDWWDKEMNGSEYGLNYLRKATEFSKKRGEALDIGCGCNGRMIEETLINNFNVTGIDVSSEMIRIVREKFPAANFIIGDFYEWHTQRLFDLIIAWDSIFHSPKELQKNIIKKMCNLLTDDGILIFTAGGNEGEIISKMNDISFYYSSLDYREYLSQIEESECKIILMERDQYPADHMVFICQRV